MSSGKDELTGMLKHVPGIARGLLRSWIPEEVFEDMLSAGNVAALEAFRRYRKGSNARFSTFAYRAVKGAILREMKRYFRMSSEAVGEQKSVEVYYKEQVDLMAVIRACGSLTRDESKAVSLRYLNRHCDYSSGKV